MPAAAPVQIVGCVLTAALLLSGCGGSGSRTAVDIGGAGRPDATATTTTARRHAGRRPHHPPAGSLCQSRLGSFVGSMDGLRRRLAVGVTYDEYVNEVHAIRSTYARIPIEKVEIDCLAAVGTPAEKAFNRYIEAANDWGNCVSELGCVSANIEPVLQRRWRIASHFLAEAEDGLRALG